MSQLSQTTLEYAVRLGDDALMLGHRLSEWCSYGPFLEEDLALSNVALDFIGRARMYFSYAAELEGKGRSEDDLAYLRDCRQYKNLLIHELPKGDFAFTMARQYLVDQYNLLFLSQLCESKDDTLAAIAAKSLKESKYHSRRSTDWMLRLGKGTEISHAKLQQAVEDLWGYTPEMFELDDLERELVEQGVAVDPSKFKQGWHKQVTELLLAADIEIPEGDWSVRGGREGYHTEHLGHLLSDLQYMQRTYPGLSW